nr:hypothetical protein PsAHV6-009 [Psittacid alphaherpesvirus 6]
MTYIISCVWRTSLNSRRPFRCTTCYGITTNLELVENDVVWVDEIKYATRHVVNPVHLYIRNIDSPS